MKESMKWIVGGFVLFLWFSMLYSILENSTYKDDTDSKTRYSGMSLYTDYGTGCQYLNHGLFGGLTPRLDETGKPFCTAENKGK